MRRSMLSVALAAVLLAAAVSPAAATTCNISPGTQTHAHGVASHWTISWSGRSPFNWSFDTGDGNYSYANGVTYTSTGLSYTFWPCSTTRFQQSLVVDDSNGIRAVQSSYATENGGSPC
jgi:hypothetical protein